MQIREKLLVPDYKDQMEIFWFRREEVREKICTLRSFMNLSSPHTIRMKYQTG